MQRDCWIVLLLLLLLLVPLLLFYLHRLLHYLCLASSYTSEPQYKHVRGMSIFRRHSPRKKNLKTSWGYIWLSDMYLLQNRNWCVKQAVWIFGLSGELITQRWQEHGGWQQW